MTHGWIFLNKPLGLTSTQASSRVRRLLNATKAGHAGTLDPLADGVLPIAVGEATKTIPFLMDAKKTYRFQVTWGERRTTDDAEGKVVEISSQRPLQKAILQALDTFKGVITQRPPTYAAVKIQGQPAYKRARAGEDFSLPLRQVIVYNFELIELNTEDTATFDVTCSAGTYVRSLARDLAEYLRTCGYVSRLTRVSVGKFNLTHTISLENFSEFVHKKEWRRVLLDPSVVLDDIPAMTLDAKHAEKIRHGQAIPIIAPEGEQMTLWWDNRLLALAQVQDGKAQPKRLFHL